MAQGNGKLISSQSNSISSKSVSPTPDFPTISLLEPPLPHVERCPLAQENSVGDSG